MKIKNVDSENVRTIVNLDTLLKTVDFDFFLKHGLSTDCYDVMLFLKPHKLMWCVSQNCMRLRPLAELKLSQI